MQDQGSIFSDDFQEEISAGSLFSDLEERGAGEIDVTEEVVARFRANAKNSKMTFGEYLFSLEERINHLKETCDRMAAEILHRSAVAGGPEPQSPTDS